MTGFLTVVLIARGLGPAGLGQYTLIQSLSGLTTSLSDLGVGQTAIRYAAQAAARGNVAAQHAVLRWAFRLRMMLAALITLLFYLLAPVIAGSVWGEASLTPLVRLGLFVGLFSALASVPMIYFQSLKRFGMNAVVMVGQSLIALGGILVLAWLQIWSISGVIVTALVSAGMGAIVFLLLIPKAALVARQDLVALSWRTVCRSPAPDNPDPQALDDTSADAFAFFMLISTVVVMLVLRADVWLMGIFLDDSQIGIYSVATRFTLPLLIVLNGLNTALWPRASSLTDLAGTVALLKKTFTLCLWAALGGAVYAVIVPFSAPWLFGDRYAGSVFLAQLLSLRYCLSILACPVGVISYCFGYVRMAWLINVLQLIIVIGLNVVLLPRVGILGAAIALLANDAVGLACIWLFIRSKLKKMRREAAA